MGEDTSHVVIHTPEEDGENGITNILKAFMRNPVAAVEIFGFAFTMFGVYYAIENQIDTVKAAQAHNYEQLNAKMDILLSSDKDQSQQIKDLYARGDTRYQQLLSRFGDQEVLLAKQGTNIEYIAKALDAKTR